MGKVVRTARFRCRGIGWEVDLRDDGEVVVYVHPTGADDYQGREEHVRGKWNRDDGRVFLEVDDHVLSHAAAVALAKAAR